MIGSPIDLLGVNCYPYDIVSGHPLSDGASPRLRPTPRAQASPLVGSEYVTFPPRDLPRTAMGWEVNPDGLRALLVRLGREYPNLPPLYVTENGGGIGGGGVGGRRAAAAPPPPPPTPPPRRGGGAAGA